MTIASDLRRRRLEIPAEVAEVVGEQRHRSPEREQGTAGGGPAKPDATG